MRRSLAALALAALLIACGDDDAADSSVPATNQPTATVGAGGVAAIPAALDFSAALVDGATFDARALAGETVLFWFWAPY